jgi:DNA/RNA-binding domain of Phe-tRNA-synthetase-like protein
MTIHVEPHPLLVIGTFGADLPEPLGTRPSPAWLTELLVPGAIAPLQSDDVVRAAVRDLLRHGGFKPKGRSKPASEYLLRAAGEGVLHSIDPVVDAANAASLHSGLPISVVDRERLLVRPQGAAAAADAGGSEEQVPVDATGTPAEPALRVGVAAAGTGYVFNPAGQVIELGGLICLHDGGGACASPVKDSQRTKTRTDTRRILVIVWGSRNLAERTATATRWCFELVQRLGGACEGVSILPAADRPSG